MAARLPCRIRPRDGDEVIHDRGAISHPTDPQVGAEEKHLAGLIAGRRRDLGHAKGRRQNHRKLRSQEVARIRSHPFYQINHHRHGFPRQK